MNAFKTILLLGPPGSGKGSIADWLVQNYNFTHIATGNIFRSLAHNDSLTAQKVKLIISNGELVPDDLTNELVKEEFDKLLQAKNQTAIVLDGYPRTLEQAQFATKNFTIHEVWLLTTPVKEILFRLTNRLICSKAGHSYHLINNPPKVSNICDYDQSPLYQRKDDRKDIILKRIEVYENLTKPLIDYYKKQNLLVTVDASKPLSFVKTSIQKLLKK